MFTQRARRLGPVLPVLSTPRPLAAVSGDEILKAHLSVADASFVYADIFIIQYARADGARGRACEHE